METNTVEVKFDDKLSPDDQTMQEDSPATYKAEALGCEIQEQTTCQVLKMNHCNEPQPGLWSPDGEWSQFYWRGVAVADVEGPHSIERVETIKKVEPIQRRDRNPDAYSPERFSLGPYHAKPVVSQQDTFKLSAVTTLLRESKTFEQLVQRIERHIPLLRKLYKEHLPQEPQTLALLFAVDAVCIVAGILYCSKALLSPSFMRDVILVENQIPVFVIRYAIQSINLAEGHPEWLCSQHIEQIVGKLLKTFSPFPYLKRSGPDLVQKFNEHRPLLGLLYDTLTTGSSSIDDDSQSYEEVQGFNNEEVEEQVSTCLQLRGKKEQRSMPRAFTLEKYGLTFKASETYFTGICFEDQGNVLVLPKIEMNENKQRFLLNLVAYEQNLPARSNLYQPVTSFVEVMGELIKEEKDVEVLMKSGVIGKVEVGGKEVGYKEVAELWKQVVSGLPQARTKSDAKVEEYVHAFTQRSLNKFWAAITTFWRGW